VLLDRSHRRWIIAAFVIVAVAVVAYVPYVGGALRGPTGGSWPGLAYGTAGLALMIYAGALRLRRRVPAWRVGRATTWMKGHIWLGLVSYVLILLHSGFHVGGTLTFVLMVLFTVVVLSGVYGLVLQQFIPTQMLVRVTLETVYEQIDSVVTQLRAAADALVEAAAGPLASVPATAESPADRHAASEMLSPGARPRPEALLGPVPEGAALREIYLAEIRSYLAPGSPAPGHLATPAMAATLFKNLRTVSPPALHDTVDQLMAICEERRQLAEQKRLHRWLHAWLLVHGPLSMTLLVLSLLHAVVSLRF
jgi:hypothetical protein